MAKKKAPRRVARRLDAPVGPERLPTGVELISTERARQISAEGWTPEHDDEHDGGELAQAAICYAMHARDRGVRPISACGKSWLEFFWPSYWLRSYWKPSPNDRIRELVKAGALIAAEIDRLQRKGSNTKLEPTADRSGPPVGSKRMLGAEKDV